MNIYQIIQIEPRSGALQIWQDFVIKLCDNKWKSRHYAEKI